MNDESTSELYAFLREAVLVETVGYTREMSLRLEELSRERVTKPLILVSSGTSAMVAGANKTFHTVVEYLSDRNISAETARCGFIGLGNFEPMLSVQFPGKARVIFHNIRSEKVTPLLDDVFHNNIPEEFLLGQFRNPRHEMWPSVPFVDELPFFSGQKRLLLKDCGLIDPQSISEYIARGGYRTFVRVIRNHTYQEICDVVEKSGLRGRSGSGYNTGSKWKIAYQTPSDQKYLICNAEESDPGAFMDRAIMEGNPHLLLEGIAIAAYAIGANKAFIYIRTEYAESIQRLEESIFSARSIGIFGDDIFGSGFNLDIIIRKGPGAFICGEETALINSLEGKRGMPQTKPPYPATSGLHKKPTVINNVETLSNIPLIVSKGADWFKSIGTEGNSGTKIFAISGKSAITGLIEVPLGTSLRTIIFNIAGGMEENKDFKAVHLGGPSGCVIPASELDKALTFDELKSTGAVMGSGGMIVLDDDSCMVDMVKYFMDFSQKQSCGKCIPCREGTRRMSEILDSITRKPLDENSHTTLERFKGVMQLESLANVMRDTSLCGLGRSAPNPVISSLKHFREEFEEHIFDRNCQANICTDLRTYYIGIDSCTGCSICAKKCPADAIIGTPRHPYFIVDEKCTGCGLCYEVCKFSAVFYR
jgi:NADH:ubiquinone oxidoreductase subunit F (NADH-binding)/Pyruvate/2-oxoacid:ferredoxin oxidoreductase delta subunit